MVKRVVVINPGSTSTKVAVFDGENGELAPVLDKEVGHPKDELEACGGVMEQRPLREQAVFAAIEEILAAKDEHPIHAVVGRGGLLHPLTGGVYEINAAMLEDLESCRYGIHACNLGAPMACELAEKLDVPCYIVDPVVTDEMREVARVTGLPRIRRRSIFHALSQRAAARRVAREMGMDYETGKFIVAHMGGGISIGAHDRGRVAEVINALDGEGPMSPERSGRLPVIPLLDMLERGETTAKELRRDILTRGGLTAHLGTNDYLRALEMMENGNENARLVLRAQAYQIAREIGSLSPTLMVDDRSPVSAVVLTGGLARSQWLTGEIASLVEHLAPVRVVAEVEEMSALAAGALGILEGRFEAGRYEP